MLPGFRSSREAEVICLPTELACLEQQLSRLSLSNLPERCLCRACRDLHQGRASPVAALGCLTSHGIPWHPMASQNGAGVSMLSWCGCRLSVHPENFPDAVFWWPYPSTGAGWAVPGGTGTCCRIYRGLFHDPWHTSSGNRRLPRRCLFLPASGTAGHGIACPGTLGEPGLGRSE